MSVYTISALIISELQLCFVNTNCDYSMFVSAGEPPADCSSIAAFHTGTTIKDRNAGNCLKTRIDRYEVLITRCCMSMSDTFDAAIEDSNAKCFYDDYDEILECLVCNLPTALSAYSASCKLLGVRASGFDRAPRGGCYSGSISIELERFIGCCP